MMQTNSQFFQVTTRVLLGDYRYCSQTVLLRQGGDPNLESSAKVTILNRQHNTLCNEIIR
ncbi:MAG: hypothetical protein HKN85_00925 [Gammaproteobacteria bacterium]|nr:hypothetical protein [Gammaproteobacteria bacterium]